MKKKNKKKNFKKIIVPTICLIVIIAIAIPAYLLTKQSKKDLITPIHVGLKENYIDVGSNYVFTNYNDFKEKTNIDILTEEDFKDNNYILVNIIYDGCAESDIVIEGYEIKKDVVNFYYTYEAGCGVCPPDYDYYIIKVDKNITNIYVDLIGKARNKKHCNPAVSYKPMIYLYPEEETDVTVKLGYPELLTTTYPKYEDKWEVTAYPNGDLKDKNGKVYYGLYWEGLNTIKTNYEDGFVVSKDELIPFFEEKLNILGLNDKESNEFIIYWLPILEKNEYNLIRFESLKEIDKQMPLYVNPKPDTIIRILMEYKPIDKDVKVKEQILNTPTREGFTLVEWGGTLIK